MNASYRRYRHRGTLAKGRWLTLSTLVVLLCALVASGCAAGSTGKVVSKPTPSPTIPLSLPNIAANTAIQQECTASHGASLTINHVQIGAHDTWQALPADLPLKPEPVSVAKIVGNLALNTISVDISLNAPSGSSVASLCAVTARIVNYQPLPAPVPNVTRACSDHTYSDPGGPDYGGDCGYISNPAASETLSFVTNLPGTAVSKPIQSQTPGVPVLIPPAPGILVDVLLELAVPTSGIYEVVIGLWQNASGPTLLTGFNEPFDTAALHEWTGNACTLATMQAQLPAPTNPPTQLLCPGAAPVQ